MSIHPEDPGPPSATRRVFMVPKRPQRVMRQGKTEQDYMPVGERPRVLEARTRLQKAKAKATGKRVVAEHGEALGRLAS